MALQLASGAEPANSLSVTKVADANLGGTVVINGIGVGRTLELLLLPDMLNLVYWQSLTIGGSITTERRCSVAKQAPRLLRTYRGMVPGRFYQFNLLVSRALAANASYIPDWVWAMNPTLLPIYLTISKKYEQVYHEALLRSRVAIAERDLLQAQITLYLDEIAAYLEAAAVRCPEVLLASGFPLAKELKGRIGTKPSAPQLEATNIESESLETGSGI